MKIFVKTLKGIHFEIEVKPEDTVADVKKSIETVQGSDVYPAAQQMLIHQRKVLKDSTTLDENKVAENSFVVIMLSKKKPSGGASTTSSAPSTQGIPQQAEVPPVAQAPAIGQAVNPLAQASQLAMPSSGPNANPLDLFPQDVPNVGSNASAGTLDFLRNSQQFQFLRIMVQANAKILQPMLRELGEQNPHLMRLILEHQAEFLHLINEPVEAEGNVLEQLAGAIPHVTLEEREALERLEEMGFDEDLVLEVFFACNKNEELAANYLFDHMHEFED